jgi:putative inorganic carbon (HCO3(-)) transporter
MRLATIEGVTAPMAASDRRAAVVTALRAAARMTFYGAVILSPFRARIMLEERNVETVFSDYTDILLFWSSVVVLAVLGLWLISLLVQPRRVDLGPLLIRVPVAMIAIAVFVAAPFSEQPRLAFANAATIVGFILLAAYVLNEVRSVSQVLPAVGAMVLIQAVVAISQVIGQHEVGLTMIGELDLDPALSGASIVWTTDAPRLLRAYGLSDHPNILGGVLAAALLVILAGLTRHRESLAVVVASGVFAIGTAAVLVTFSRAAALGLGAGLAFALLLVVVRRDRHTLGTWFAACVVAAMIAVPFVVPYADYWSARVNPGVQPAGSTEQRSIEDRGVQAERTAEIFLDHPVVGVGAGVLPEAMLAAYAAFTYNYFPAHVAVLVVAAETGVVGAGAYGLLVLAPFVLLWLHRRRLTPELIAMSGALLALTVVGLFDYYTWSLNTGRFWFWLALGL